MSDKIKEMSLSDQVAILELERDQLREEISRVRGMLYVNFCNDEKKTKHQPLEFFTREEFDTQSFSTLVFRCIEKCFNHVPDKTDLHE